MSFDLANLLKVLLRAGVVLLVLNEIRGVILAAPVFYAIYMAGGNAAAIWLGICSLGGIALSVAIPALAFKKLAKTQARS